VFRSYEKGIRATAQRGSLLLSVFPELASDNPAVCPKDH
jgi:hypothetical protein